MPGRLRVTPCVVFSVAAWDLALLIGARPGARGSMRLT